MNNKLMKITMDECIDWMCECNGIGWTIKFLIDCGWSKSDLLAGGFDEETIHEIMMEVDEDNFDECDE